MERSDVRVLELRKEPSLSLEVGDVSQPLAVPLGVLGQIDIAQPPLPSFATMR